MRQRYLIWSLILEILSWAIQPQCVTGHASADNKNSLWWMAQAIFFSFWGSSRASKLFCISEGILLLCSQYSFLTWFVLCLLIFLFILALWYIKVLNHILYCFFCPPSVNFGSIRVKILPRLDTVSYSTIQVDMYSA